VRGKNYIVRDRPERRAGSDFSRSCLANGLGQKCVPTGQNAVETVHSPEYNHASHVLLAAGFKVLQHNGMWLILSLAHAKETGFYAEPDLCGYPQPGKRQGCVIGSGHASPNSKGTTYLVVLQCFLSVFIFGYALQVLWS
jgi:hypothetical protein